MKITQETSLALCEGFFIPGSVEVSFLSFLESFLVSINSFDLEILGSFTFIFLSYKSPLPVII